MIDLHCHLLPGIDDGARDLEMSLEMARIAIADGIKTTACTPHIYPGLFENDAAGIRRHVVNLTEQFAERGVPLSLTFGADIQMVPELLSGLASGLMPTINDSRYFLFEPPHHMVPVRFSELLFEALAAGYVPVITHPERLTWLDDKHYLSVTAWFISSRPTPTNQFTVRQFCQKGNKLQSDGSTLTRSTASSFSGLKQF